MPLRERVCLLFLSRCVWSRLVRQRSLWSNTREEVVRAARPRLTPMDDSIGKESPPLMKYILSTNHLTRARSLQASSLFETCYRNPSAPLDLNQNYRVTASQAAYTDIVHFLKTKYKGAGTSLLGNVLRRTSSASRSYEDERERSKTSQQKMKAHHATIQALPNLFRRRHLSLPCLAYIMSKRERSPSLDASDPTLYHTSSPSSSASAGAAVDSDITSSSLTPVQDPLLSFSEEQLEAVFRKTRQAKSMD